MTEPQRLTANERRPRQANGQYVHKLSQPLIAAICGAIATGSTQKDAALIAGLNESTFYRWIENGRNGGTKLERTLVAEVDKTSAQVRSNLSSIAIAAAQAGDGRLALELLKHRPDSRADYRETSRIELDANVQHDHRHTIDLGALSLDDKRQMLELMRRARMQGEIVEGGGQVLELPRGSE